MLKLTLASHRAFMNNIKSFSEYRVMESSIKGFTLY